MFWYRRDLNELAEQCSVHVIEVSGHSDISENCRAHPQARLANTIRLLGVFDLMDAALATLILGKLCWLCQHEIGGFRNEQNGRQSLIRSTIALLKLQRKALNKLAGIPTGHCIMST